MTRAPVVPPSSDRGWRDVRALWRVPGFAVLLLPYSLIGPFAGVLLDHWRRTRVHIRC